MITAQQVQVILSLQGASPQAIADVVNAQSYPLEVSGQVASYQHWKDRVIRLKMENPKMSQKELAEVVGVSIHSVKKHMCQPETKKAIAEQKEQTND